MEKRLNFLPALLFAGLLVQTSATMAHTPLFDCFDEDNGKIVCEAGFSDGASAEGIDVRVVNAQGRVVQQGKIEADGSVSFDRPDEEFSVQFQAGEQHTITVIGDDIY